MAENDKAKVIKALAESDVDVEKEVERRKMELIKTLLTSEPKGDPVTEIARLTFIKDLIKDFARKTEESEDKILGKVITWAMVNQAFQSTQPKQSVDPTTLLTLVNMSKGSGNDWMKLMQLYLQQQQQMYQQQAQLQQQLFTMIFGKQKSDIEDLKAKTEDMINRLNERIDMLMSSQGSSQPGIKEYLQQMIEVRDTLKEAVEKLGVVEKAPEVVDKSGKVQLGKLLERGLKIAERIIEKMPAQQPAPRPVQMMPVEQPVMEIKETKPKIEEEIKPVEQKLEKLEKKVEELPKIEAIIPERPPRPAEVTKEETPIKVEEVKEKAPEKVEEVKEETPKVTEETKETAPEVKAQVEIKEEEEPIVKYEYTAGEETTSESPEEQEASE